MAIERRCALSAAGAMSRGCDCIQTHLRGRWWNFAGGENSAGEGAERWTNYSRGVRPSCCGGNSADRDGCLYLQYAAGGRELSSSAPAIEVATALLLFIALLWTSDMSAVAAAVSEGPSMNMRERPVGIMDMTIVNRRRTGACELLDCRDLSSNTCRWMPGSCGW